MLSFTASMLGCMEPVASRRKRMSATPFTLVLVSLLIVWDGLWLG